MTEHIVHQPLPRQTQLVADAIGRDRAMYLAYNWKRLPSCNPKRPRRISIYIPAKLTLDHELVRVMGWNDAEKLVKAFRGEILEISMCSNVSRGWRDTAIRRLAKDARMKPAELATWFDISERHVRNVLKEIPTEERLH
jgi:hypothetical protein